MVNNKPVHCSASRLEPNLSLPSPSSPITPIPPPTLPVAHSFCSITSRQAGDLMQGSCLFPWLPTTDPATSTGTPFPGLTNLPASPPPWGGEFLEHTKFRRKSSALADDGARICLSTQGCRGQPELKDMHRATMVNQTNLSC